MSEPPLPPGPGVDAVAAGLPAATGDGLPAGRVEATGRAGLDGLVAAPSAHAGLYDTSALAGPQAARQTAASSAAASPQARERLRPDPPLLPHRMAAGPRPVLPAPPRSFRGSRFVIGRAPALA